MSDKLELREGSSQGPLMLVADDDASIRSLIVRVLRQIGVSALVASDGATAVQLVLEHRATLCCAILDVRMPVLDGIEAAGQIRQIAPDLAIVMMSSHFPSEYLHWMEPLDVARTLEKPFRLSELRAVLHNISAAWPRVG
jgi:CheY-like chemotaxis protein